MTSQHVMVHTAAAVLCRVMLPWYIQQQQADAKSACHGAHSSSLSSVWQTVALIQHQVGLSSARYESDVAVSLSLS